MFNSISKVFKEFPHNYREQTTLKKLKEPKSLAQIVTIPGLGRSVIAKTTLSSGSLIGIYPGKRLHISEFAEKNEFLKKSLRFAFLLSEDQVIDPTDIFGQVPDRDTLYFALMNEPPLGKKVNVFPISSGNNIWLLAIRDIEVGEQLFTTYGPKYTRSYSSEMTDKNGQVAFEHKQIELLKLTAKRYPWLSRGVSNILTSLESQETL